MKAVVGIMGVLIIIGTTVVVGTVIHRLYARFAAPSIPAAPLAAPMAPVAGNAVMPAAPAAVAAELAPGEHIAGIAAAGPDVAVWVSGPKGERVLLLDPANGTVRVGLQTAP